MKRGGVYLADLGQPVGHEQGLRRPVILVSADPWLGSNPPVVAVVPLTRTRRQYTTHVEVERGRSGLQDVSYAKCEDVRSISPRRLLRPFGQVEPAALAQIDLILRRLLAL